MVSIFTKALREGDGCHLTLGGGGVLVDQVGVGWVCTIVNSAGVPWLIECAFYKHTSWINWVDTNFKVSVCDICGKKCDTDSMELRSFFSSSSACVK